MKRIEVYDIEAEDLEELAEKHDVSEAEIVEALFNAIRDWNINIEDYI